MRELVHRQKFKRRLYSVPVLAGLLLITILSVRGAYSIIKKERESSREAKGLAEKVELLTEREKVLQKEIERLNTEAGIEEEIKSKFNVANAGEHVALIVDKPEKNGVTTTPEKISWWKRFFDAIIGH